MSRVYDYSYCVAVIVLSVFSRNDNNDIDRPEFNNLLLWTFFFIEFIQLEILPNTFNVASIHIIFIFKLYNFTILNKNKKQSINKCRYVVQ